MNRWIRFVAVAVTGLLMTGCVTPATGHDSYSDKPVTSMRAETSEVQTARLVLQLLPRHRILGPYADEALTGCEKAAGSIPATFGSVHRPAATVSGARPGTSSHRRVGEGQREHAVEPDSARSCQQQRECAGASLLHRAPTRQIKRCRPTASSPGFPGRGSLWKGARFRAEQLLLVRLLELIAPLRKVAFGDDECSVWSGREPRLDSSHLFVGIDRRVYEFTLCADL
jgi:hypothetical protein